MLDSQSKLKMVHMYVCDSHPCQPREGRSLDRLHDQNPWILVKIPGPPPPPSPNL